MRTLAAALLALAIPVSLARAASDADLEAGRKIYNFRCYFCHGYSGNARTLARSYLEVPPRDFTQLDEDELSRSRMIESVTFGRPGTAMTGFQRVLSNEEIAQVVDFIRMEFIRNKAVNTRYHTPANGWSTNLTDSPALPFATGAIPLDAAPESLDALQLKGRQLFLRTCVSCHDRGTVVDEGPIWSSESISYPRNRYSHRQQAPTTDELGRVVDGVTAASIYAIHDQPPTVEQPTPEQVKGKQLYEQNCAFCHAADGTGRNWIGSFLKPRPRDLTDGDFMQSMTRPLLRQRIREGLPGTAMPAWKSVLSEQEIEAIVSYVDVAFHTLADPGQ